MGVTPWRDRQLVHPLTTFVRSLGNAGALANAQAMLDARDREDWIIQGLTWRLDRPAASEAVAAAPVATRAVA